MNDIIKYLKTLGFSKPDVTDIRDTQEKYNLQSVNHTQI